VKVPWRAPKISESLEKFSREKHRNVRANFTRLRPPHRRARVVGATRRRSCESETRGFDCSLQSRSHDVINIHPQDHLFPYIALWQGCYHRRRCYHPSCRSFFIGQYQFCWCSREPSVEMRRRLRVSRTLCLKLDVNPITKAKGMRIVVVPVLVREKLCDDFP